MFQLDIIVAITAKVDSRGESRHDVRPMIIKTFGSKNKVDGAGDVHSLHGLFT